MRAPTSLEHPPNKATLCRRLRPRHPFHETRVQSSSPLSSRPQTENSWPVALRCVNIREFYNFLKLIKFAFSVYIWAISAVKTTKILIFGAKNETAISVDLNEEITFILAVTPVYYSVVDCRPIATADLKFCYLDNYK